MQLTILGNASGGPFHGRHYSAQVLQMENHMFLIDCGEGTQMQLYRHKVKIDRCDHIFISHLHGDHVFGLIGLLTNWCLKKRTKTLHLFSPPGLRELVEHTARLCKVKFPYAIEFCEVDAIVSTKIFENEIVEVWTIPLDHHRIETAGWLFREKTRPRNILPEKIGQYDIPYTLIPGIKAGDDLRLPDGSLVPNAELTIDPPVPRAYAYCSDTAPSQAVAEVVRGVQLLYHEATFTETHREEAALAYHSTARQAAEIAKKAGVGRLLLGHFSGRYNDVETHLSEARAIFPATDA
ncbi:MAG: ribonuclease Z, partial [Saprospiraceae bacterium]|nr:ribonuclease Z [Saprospiraceae bacterium]